MNNEWQSFANQYNLWRCNQCGKCTGGCPVSSKAGLNMRLLLNAALNEEPLERLSTLPEIWDCTACNTCSMRCPNGLEPLEALIGLRSILVENGSVQQNIREALESVFLEGNPWGKPRSMRSDWMEGLSIRHARPGGSVDYLVFVCCTVAYDPQLQMIARNLVRLLEAAGVDYGFIGNEESCCGSEVYSLGETGLFALLEEQNTELINSFNPANIVAISPHCYSIFISHYDALHGTVIHYTHLLQQLLQEQKIGLKPDSGGETKVVFQDPCFLGKRHQVFDEPRQILGRLPGVELVDFDRCRQRSLCCGGGGGKMWLETEAGQERLAVKRVQDARQSGAGTIAVACPFCYLTLDDAVKDQSLEQELSVSDLLTMINEHLLFKSPEVEQ